MSPARGARVHGCVCRPGVPGLGALTSQITWSARGNSQVQLSSLAILGPRGLPGWLGLKGLGSRGYWRLLGRGAPCLLTR